MNDWVGPAIVAAVIAGLISVAGWFVTTRQTLAIERARRMERTRDFQIALTAEIRSELASLNAYAIDTQIARVSASYEADSSYSIFVPLAARHSISEAIVADIPILPEHMIEPVVLYMRQREVVDGLQRDFRTPEFRNLSVGRQLEIYKDYLDLRSHLGTLAETLSLHCGSLCKIAVSSQVAGLSAR